MSSFRNGVGRCPVWCLCSRVQTLRVQSRLSTTSSVPVNVLKSVGYAAVLWTVFLVAFPALIRWAEQWTGLDAIRFEPGLLRGVAILFFSVGGLVAFWCAFLLVRLGDGTPMPLECTHQLVIAGPFRYIRNPMSTVGIVQGVAVGLYLGSPLTVVYALAGALLWNNLLRPWEEQDLSDRFGAEYDRYRRSVPCWVPRLRPYLQSSSLVRDVRDRD